MGEIAEDGGDSGGWGRQWRMGEIARMGDIAEDGGDSAGWVEDGGDYGGWGR